MIKEQSHVCAHTPPTTAQRRAALIADATVAANATFGRDAIAALQGQWHADDECAELRFTYKGRGWRLAPFPGPAGGWMLGDGASTERSFIVIEARCGPAEAAAQFQAALHTVWADVVMPHLPRVFDAIRAERERQHAKWGQQDHDPYTWLAVLGEEFGEVSQAILHDTFGGNAAGTLREELTHVAAVACQWLECLERQAAREDQPA